MTDAPLPRPDVELPVRGTIARPDRALVERLAPCSSATASAIQHLLGVRRTFVQGPVAQLRGAKAVGPAVTLQFMPQREDVASGLAQEEIEKRSALWAAMEAIEPGDVLVVQAYGDPHTGCLGEMLLTYLKGRGCAGVVVDGCTRDSPRLAEIGLPVWSRGATPNYASQGRLYPWAYNVPIACSDVLVLPGDLVVADDDGAVCVPKNLAPPVAEQAAAHEGWEEFSRARLAEGGALSRYYPLDEQGRREYEEWLRRRER